MVWVTLGYYLSQQETHVAWCYVSYHLERSMVPNEPLWISGVLFGLITRWSPKLLALCGAQNKIDFPMDLLLFTFSLLIQNILRFLENQNVADQNVCKCCGKSWQKNHNKDPKNNNVMLPRASACALWCSTLHKLGPSVIWHEKQVWKQAWVGSENTNRLHGHMAHTCDPMECSLWWEI